MRVQLLPFSRSSLLIQPSTVNSFLTARRLSPLCRHRPHVARLDVAIASRSNLTWLSRNDHISVPGNGQPHGRWMAAEETGRDGDPPEQDALSLCDARHGSNAVC